MQSEHVFIRDEVYPSWYVNALGHFLSLGAFGFVVSKLNNTTIEVVAGADEAAAIVSVAGRWRWMEATVTRAHPGGGSGTYDIYVTARDTDIVTTPAPYTDNTVYDFALAIVAAGATPTIVAGSVEIFRKVGSLTWDGTKIAKITQTVPSTPPHAVTHAVGGTDPLAPADIGAAAAVDLTAEITNRGAAVTAEAAARIAADNGEATARTAAVNGEASTRATAITAEANARQANDAVLLMHVAEWASDVSPVNPAGTIIGEIPSEFFSGQGWALVGVAMKCSTLGSTPTVFKVQSDNSTINGGASAGTLADVHGLTALQPATGRFAEVDASVGGTVAAVPVALARHDSVALVLVTPGNSLGCKVALLFKRTA